MFHTGFYVSAIRSIGQVDKMEFDEIGQRDFLFHTYDLTINVKDVFKYYMLLIETIHARYTSCALSSEFNRIFGILRTSVIK